MRLMFFTSITWSDLTKLLSFNRQTTFMMVKTLLWDEFLA